MHVKIDVHKCVGCGICIEYCPTHAAYNKKGKTFIDESKCTLCHNCEGMCIASALTFEEETPQKRLK